MNALAKSHWDNPGLSYVEVLSLGIYNYRWIWVMYLGARVLRRRASYCGTAACHCSCHHSQKSAAIRVLLYGSYKKKVNLQTFMYV